MIFCRDYPGALIAIVVWFHKEHIFELDTNPTATSEVMEVNSDTTKRRERKYTNWRLDWIDQDGNTHVTVQSEGKPSYGLFPR
jgi:hypothetical protein